MQYLGRVLADILLMYLQCMNSRCWLEIFCVHLCIKYIGYEREKVGEMLAGDFLSAPVYKMHWDADGR
ncbi:hypothetical protein K7X08_036715 [Anisodus acutangulus]|uniref:Uncharacterized protein n=1 Tax=Anisodus acutangulus TaxID=402998 RepID=A0A9Q1L7P4_9SOLA|nr:hypothetical protein K7X08_036715 [Anisodus acutangulus]